MANREAENRQIDDGFTVDKAPVTTVTFVAYNAAPTRTAAVGEIDIIVITPDQQ